MNHHNDNSLLCKIISCLDYFVFRFWIIFCSITFCFSIVIKALYSMEDYPYFVINKGRDIVFLLINLLIYICLFEYRKVIQEKVNYAIIWLFFGTIAILFIILVPLIPFSDMSFVADGALSISKLDFEAVKTSEYMQLVVKNIKVSMFYGFLTIFMPKNIISFKIINVFLYLLSSHFIAKTASNLGFKYYKIVFIIASSMISVVGYCNHIYFDLPTLFLCSAGMCFYTDDRRILKSAICFGLAAALRTLAYIFLIAIVADYLFNIIKNEKTIKSTIKITSFIVITLLIPITLNCFVNSLFLNNESEPESIWTQFYMGINEEEFGFMHNEILEEGQKDFNDFYELLLSRNLKQNIKLFSKKIFWTWTQGTYQSQRYSFGNNVMSTDEKFQYSTPITRYLLNENNLVRRMIDSFSRAQYLALFLLMIIGLLCIISNNGIEKYRVFVYLMFGTFLILVFYEIKSRYVLHCIIPMVILSIVGAEKIDCLIHEKSKMI